MVPQRELCGYHGYPTATCPTGNRGRDPSEDWALESASEANRRRPWDSGVKVISPLRGDQLRQMDFALLDGLTYQSPNVVHCPAVVPEPIEERPARFDDPGIGAGHAERFDCTVCHESLAELGPDVRFDPTRQVCTVCHDPRNGGAWQVHDKHVMGKAQCYACMVIRMSTQLSEAIRIVVPATDRRIDHSMKCTRSMQAI